MTAPRPAGAAMAPLEEDALEPAARLLEVCGFGYSPSWVRWLAKHPDCHAYGAFRDRQLLGTGIALRYGMTSGWIGLIAVDPEERGKGLGRALTETCVAWLRAQGVPSILLSATDMGRPVYEKLGFETTLRYVVMRREGTPWRAPQAETVSPDLLAAVSALDREASGEDRTRVITRLGTRPLVLPGDPLPGYFHPTPFGRGAVVARTAAAAEALLTGAVEMGVRDLRVPESQVSAIRFLEGLGLTAVRIAPRMALDGHDVPLRPDWLYSMIDPAIG